MPMTSTVRGQLKHRSIILLYPFCNSIRNVVWCLVPLCTSPSLFNTLAGFISLYCISGTSISAMIREINRMMVIAQGKSSRKSCIIPVMVIRNGKNVIEIANVAAIIALKNSVALFNVAVFRSIPCPSRSTYSSIITTELSTIIPSDTMRQANVTVFSSIPST